MTTQARLWRVFAFLATLTLGSCDAGPTGPSGGVAGVQVSPADPQLELGTSQQLQAVVLGAGGDTLQGKRVVWASERPEIAEVSATGMVRALAPGSTRIAASSGGENGYAAVAVVPRPVAGGEKVGGGVGTGVPGQPLPDSLAVRVVNTAGEPVAGVEVTWSVSSGSISPPTSVTNADGVAKAQWTLGTQPGEQTATAQAGEITLATFAVTAQVAAPPPAPSAPAAVATVEVTPSSARLGVGGSVELGAVARDTAGNALTGRTVGWRSANPDVATVNGAGRVTAAKPGTATIVATVEGRTGTAQVTVTEAPPPAVARVTVEPGSSEFTALGATRQFRATAGDASGKTISGVSILWSSSNPDVARVNSGGLATAVGNGTTTITARSGDVSGTATLAVNQRVARVVVSPSEMALTEGETADAASAVAFDANGRRVSGAAVTWSSSKSSVAEVNASSGRITAKQPGSATVTATADGKSAALRVSVSARPAVPVATVAVVPSSGTIPVDGIVDLDAQVRDAAGNLLTGRALSWRSENIEVASVDGRGRVAGKSPGNTTIVATVEGKIGTAQITVTAPPPPVVVSVKVEPESATLTSLGATRQFTATARDADGRAISGLPVSWRSSATDVAEVTSGGLATAVGNGTASVVATVGGVIGTATLTINQRVDRVVVSPSELTLTEGETSDVLSAVAFDANDRQVAGAQIRWASSETRVAEVDASTGRVTAKQSGRANIVASAGGVTGKSEIRVVDRPPASVERVEVSPPSGTVRVGGTIDLDAVARDAAGNALTGRSISWKSSNTEQASVDGSGTVTGKAPGTVTITATVEGRSGTAQVTVDPAPAPVVAEVTVEPGSAMLSSLGATQQFRATARDVGGNAIPGLAVSWRSSNADVVEVTSGGLATAVGNGTTTVTAVVGGASGTATLTVDQQVERVVVSPSELTLTEGEASDALSAAAFDANDRRVGDAAFTWSSSNPSVATVDGNGRVTGVSAGNTTIRAMSEGRTGTASIRVRQPPAPTPTVLRIRTAEGQRTEFQGERGDRFGLRVVVTDGNGNPVPGVSVRWTADDGGTIDGSKNKTVVTDRQGLSAVVWTLGGKKKQVAEASIPGGSVTFRAQIR